MHVSPVLAVRDLARALEHYAALGCGVRSYSDGYGYAVRDGAELHLVVVPRPIPLAASTVYLHVPDADALGAEWARVEQTAAPEDTPWGMREGWHLDPDGNLLRFGSPLARA